MTEHEKEKSTWRKLTTKKGKLTTEEQEELWRQMRRRKGKFTLIALIGIGMFFLVWEGSIKFKDFQHKRKQSQQIDEIINTPSIDNYLVLLSTNRKVYLRTNKFNLDSINFDICHSASSSYKQVDRIDVYEKCNQSSKEITIAKKDLLETKCDSKKDDKMYCHLIPELDSINPFRIHSAYTFHGVELTFKVVEHKGEKDHTVLLRNKGLPIIIKKIESSASKEIEIIYNTLPLQLNTNATIKIIIPASRKVKDQPSDFKIFLESEKNGAEIYEAVFDKSNYKINSKNLVNE